MMRVELRLRLREGPPAEAAAWFLPGDDPAEWLAELAAGGAPLAGLRIWPVPRSRRDRTPCGALVPLPTPLRPARGSRAQPWQVRARKLYFPADAALEPEVHDGELDELLPGALIVLHPAAGLISFDAADGRAPAALLELPPQRDAAWDVATAGVAGVRRLLSVEPESPPTLERVLEEGRGDIGSRAPEELPPAPGEPREGLMDRMGKWAGQRVAHAAWWLSDLAPKTSPEPTWIDRMRDWLTQQNTRLRSDLESARHREILRLMHLLEADPDQGLKFALPLKGLGSRGVAPPGGRLTPRDTNFDLGRLRGGGPGDSWSVPWQVHEQLRARYRDLANRELRLGRHRRAAYILAELLADYSAAAGALIQGRHFREAAVIYRDHLKRPQEAARCLEQGGLLGEAAALYESLGHFETAGDLYARMDRRDEAAVLWRRAADRHREGGEVLAACRLLEEKVRAPDEALALLAATWPWSEQAGVCLRERLALLGRLARHDDARALVVQLRREPPPSGRVTVLAQALGSAAGAYPDAQVRRSCADAVRVVAGRALPHATLAETTELVQSVTRLVPEDRLLGRDGNRFLLRRRAQLASRAVPAGGGGTDPVLVGQFRLPRDVTWKAAASQGRVFYAAGTVAGGLVVVRGLWDGMLQQVRWEVPVPSQARVVLQPGAISTHPTLVALPGGPRLEMLRFEATEALPVTTRVGSPPGLPDRYLSLAYGEQSTVWVLAEEDGRLVLTARTLDGSLVATKAVPPSEEADAAAPASAGYAIAPVLTRRDTVYFAVRNRVVALLRGESFVSCEVQDSVLDLTGSDPLSRTRVAATFEWGGAVLWGGLDWGNVRTFGERLWRPLATFTRDGSLVAIAQGEGQVFSTHNLAILHRRTFPSPENVPLALLPAAGLSEFALFGADGTVRVYRLQGG